MATTPFQLASVDEALSQYNGGFTKLPKITVPNTTITKRAQCVDPSNDGVPRMGINRIMTQAIEEVQGESGPNGERVWKPINDYFDQIRFVGAWTNQSPFSGGSGPYPSLAADYVEIVFYGTGLNLLYNASATTTIVYSLDGGSNVTAVSSAAYNSILNGRGYSPNQAINILSSASLGLHTIKISTTVGLGWNYMGFEVLNQFSFTATTNSNTSLTSPSINPLTTGLASGMPISGTGIPLGATISSVTATSITISASATTSTAGTVISVGALALTPGTSYIGGRKLASSSLLADSYNSNFASGTLTAANGGHVVVYQTSTGAIQKAIQSNAGSPSYLTSANHANESVIRSYSFLEFSAGRADDYSTFNTVGSSWSRAFTLDDGTTTLVTFGSAGTGFNATGVGMDGASGTSSTTFMFVGTGLDIFINQSGTFGTTTLTVDGVSQGNLANTTATPTILKIASGLPYGTHTVKIAVTAGGSTQLYLNRFIVYGPTKPTIPANSVELADYYLMGNYVASASATEYVMPTGVLRKAVSVREALYTGTWTIPSIDIANLEAGWNTQTSTSGSTASYTFFGTGFEWSQYVNNTTFNTTYSVDGSTNLSGFTTSLLQTSSGLSFTASTGVLSGTSAAIGRIKIIVSGLALGLHTVKLTTNNTVSNYTDCLDIITPIHSPAISNLPGDLQNTLTVGSQAISDNRKVSTQVVKTLANWTQAVGVATTASTTSLVLVPMPDMSLTLKTTGNPIEITFMGVFTMSVANECDTFIYVDGVQVGTYGASYQPTATAVVQNINAVIVPVAAGVHVVQVYWAITNAGTLNANSTRRILRAREIS